MITDARSYVDLSAVHLMTTSTIDAVAAASEADDVTSSRFRPNIVVDSGPAVEFLEDGWGMVGVFGQGSPVDVIDRGPHVLIPKDIT